MTDNRLAIVMASPPLASFHNQEGLELAMLCASYGQQVSLFFVDDGVWQLHEPLDANQVLRKNFTKSLAALEFYDIEHLYVCEDSLAQRNMHSLVNGLEIQLLSATRLSQLLADHQQVLRF